MGIDLMMISAVSSVLTLLIAFAGTILFLPKLRAKNKFDLLFFKQTKWYEKEYEVLTQVWKNLAYLLTEVSGFVNPMPHIANLDIMDDERLEIFFKDNEITDSEKKYLTDEQSKTGSYLYAYATILNIRAEKKAIIAINNFIGYFQQHRVFLKPDIKKKFEELYNKIEEVVILQQKFETPADIKFGEEASEKLENEVLPLVKEMEERIQGILFPTEQ